MRRYLVRREIVDGARDGEGVVRNKVQTILGINYALGEVVVELLCARRLARGWQPGDDDQLE